MQTILYNICLFILSLLLWPKILWNRVFLGKYKGNFLQRLGIKLPQFTIPQKRRPIVWIHCVSVGEVRACSAIASQLKEDNHETYLIISTVTETGQKEARRTIPYADSYFFLPLDLAPVMRKIVRKIRPNLFLLAETDFWYNLLAELKKIQTKIILVNGKISQGSLKKFMLIKPLSKRMFNFFDMLCVQNTHYLLSFQKLGVKPNRMISTGNLKFDAHVKYLSEEEKNALKEKIGIKKDEIVITIGSTHDNEEDMLLSHFENIWAFFPQVKVILVPRHPERFMMVKRLLDEKRLTYVTYSTLPEKNGHEKVILIDRMGILNDLYQISSLAIVAGSYVPKIGGHNIFEPIEFGVPVIYGPYMNRQKSLDQLVKQSGAGKKIHCDELPQFISEFLESPAMQMTMRKAALKIRGDAKGSAKRTWEVLQRVMEEKSLVDKSML
jgi:3-deoxy-D-manno-octulosonic-acid transferase